MCSNFEAIKRDRAFLLNFPDPPQLVFPDEIYPTYNAPLVFSNHGNIKWRKKNRFSGGPLFGIAHVDLIPSAPTVNT